MGEAGEGMGEDLLFFTPTLQDRRWHERLAISVGLLTIAHGNIAVKPSAFACALAFLADNGYRGSAYPMHCLSVCV